MKLTLKVCLVAASLLALTSAAALAQRKPEGTIQGTVLNASGKALTGAHVTLTRATSDSHMTKMTGMAGYFMFRNLTPGSYQVKTTAQGYAPKIQPSVVVMPGKITRDTIRLKPAAGAGGQPGK